VGSAGVTGVFSVGSAGAPSFPLLVLLRALTGFGLGGISIPFTLFTEFLPHRKRGLYLLLMNVFWSIGTMYTASVAWLPLFPFPPSPPLLPCSLFLPITHISPRRLTIPTLGWRWFIFFTSLPVFVPLALFFIVPESPRFLSFTGRKEQVVEVLRQGPPSFVLQTLGNNDPTQPLQPTKLPA